MDRQKYRDATIAIRTFLRGEGVSERDLDIIVPQFADKMTRLAHVRMEKWNGSL